MGWQLREHVERHAPASLTHREIYVLSILASAAFNDTRLCEPYAPELVDRLRLGSTETEENAALLTQQIKRVVSALVRKGALTVVVRGQKGRVAVYRVSDFGIPVPLAQGAQIGTPDFTPTGAQGALIGTPEPASGVPNRTFRGPKSDPPPQTRKNPPPPAHETQRPLPPQVVTGEGAGSMSENDLAVDGLVAAASSALAAVGGDRMTGSQLAQLRMSLQAAVVHGWSVAELRTVVGRSLEGARDPYAVLRRRVEEKAQEAPADIRPQATSTSVDWCEQCEADHYRFIPTERGDRPCPNCHPNAPERRQEATA